MQTLVPSADPVPPVALFFIADAEPRVAYTTPWHTPSPRPDPSTCHQGTWPGVTPPAPSERPATLAPVAEQSLTGGVGCASGWSGPLGKSCLTTKAWPLQEARVWIPRGWRRLRQAVKYHACICTPEECGTCPSVWKRLIQHQLHEPLHVFQIPSPHRREGHLRNAGQVLCMRVWKLEWDASYHTSLEKPHSSTCQRQQQIKISKM